MKRFQNIFLSMIMILGLANESYAATTEEMISKLPSIEVLTEHIKQFPNEPAGYFARATRYQLSNKQLGEAIADWTKGIELNNKPDGFKDTTPYDMRAVCYLQTKSWDAGIADLTKSIETNPQNALAYSNRAVGYLEKKQFALAMKDDLKALQLNPRNAVAYEGIGETCFKTRQYTRALEYLNRAISMESTQGEAYYYRGSTYQALGKKAEADRDYLQAKKLGFKLGEISVYTAK